MTDEANKETFTVAYTEGTSLTVYKFVSKEECGDWETEMMALKHAMAYVNETFTNFNYRKCEAYASWLDKFNTFVSVWSIDKTPADIVFARESIVAALVSVDWSLPV